MSLGSTISKSVKFSIPFKDDSLFNGKKVVIYIGLQTDTSIEWIKKATLNIIKTTKNGNLLEFECYDSFYFCENVFITELKGNQKIKDIVNEQCSKLNIVFNGEIEDVTYNIDLLQGLTVREVFSYLSAYCGKNAHFNSNDELEFIGYTEYDLEISPDRYVSIETAEQDTTINSLTCITKKSKTDEDGNIELIDETLISGDGFGISFSCLGMTQERLDILYQRFKGFTYRSCEIDLSLSYPELECGDILIVSDLEGNKYKVPVMEVISACDGGFQSEIKSFAKTEQESEFEFKGSLANQVERNYTEYASFKEVTTEKITAFSGQFGKIDTDILNVNKELNALKGTIESLDVGDLTARVTKIETSYVDKQYVNENYVNIQYANQTYAVKSEIKDLTADVAKINTLLAGSVTAGSTQTIVLNAENTTIANALIKDANIDSLSFNKMTGVDFNTSKFSVHSNDGLSTWKDNTILIKDSVRNRVQIGKDAQGDYNIYIWDKNGKLMFDPLGLTEDGVNREVIDNSNVKEDAGIKGSKLDIDSVVTSINGATTTIKSSKIYFDDKKQSLDVVFNTMSNTVEENSSKLNTQSTQISTAQGQISTLITDVTQVKKDITATKGDITAVKGNVTTLTNNYSSLKQTVDGINSTVAGHTTSITNIQATANNALNTANSKAKVFTATPTTPYKVGDLWVQGSTGVIMKCKVARASGTYVSSDWEKADKYTDDTTANKVRTDLTATITTVSDKATKLEQSLDGFKTTVSNTYATKTQLNTVDGKFASYSTTNAMNSAITQAKNEISQKVTSVETNVTNITKTVNDNKANWDKAPTALTNANNAQATANTANSTANAAKLLHEVETISGNLRKFKNVCGYTKDDQNVKGCIVITTPITPSRMVSVHIKGYNYVSNQETIDLTIGFYNYTNSFISNGYINNGSFKFNSIKVAKVSSSDNRAVIMLGDIDTVWQYPKIIVDEVIVGYSTASPDSYKDGFSCSLVTTIPTTYTNVTALSGTDFKTEITTTKNTVAEHTTSLNNITSRVSTTESNITKINGNITALQEFKNTAEQKITDSAIVATVTKSTSWNNLNNTANAAKNTADQAQVGVEEAKTNANDAITDLSDELNNKISKSESSIEQLADSIKYILVNENGETMLTQDGDKWTFNMSKVLKDIENTVDELGGLDTIIDNQNGQLESLQSTVNDLTKLNAYVQIKSEGSEPCIELGNSSKFKLRITNTSIKFMNGDDVLAFVDKDKIKIKNAEIEDELVFGGFAFKKRENGNMGLIWKG